MGLKEKELLMIDVQTTDKSLRMTAIGDRAADLVEDFFDWTNSNEIAADEVEKAYFYDISGGRMIPIAGLEMLGSDVAEIIPGSELKLGPVRRARILATNLKLRKAA